MFDGDLRISRWVLALEMLCCFTPLTLLCLAVLANLGRLEGAPIHGATTHAGLLALTVVATGPIGLMVAFKVIVLNRPSLTRVATMALWILAAWTAVTYTLFILAQGAATHAWRELVLIALLPVVGIVHLIYLAKRQIGKLAAG